VQVTMTFGYHWLGFLGLGTGSTISASSTMRLESIPTNFTAGCT
jgi:hypothetical protein